MRTDGPSSPPTTNLNILPPRSKASSNAAFYNTKGSHFGYRTRRGRESMWPDDTTSNDNIWLEPLDHRTIPKLWRRIGWFLLSALHVTVAVLAFQIVIRRFWFQDESLVKDTYIVGLALANIVVDIVVIGIVVIIYLFVYTMGGEFGVRTTTGIISLLIDGLQTVAYVCVALYAWTISILLIKKNFSKMPECNDKISILKWINRILITFVDAFKYDTVKAMFLVCTVCLGTFYIVYSTDTFIGISKWIYKKALSPAAPFIQFFNPSQRSPYVYLTGPEPYLDSLEKLNRRIQRPYEVETELTRHNLDRLVALEERKEFKRIPESLSAPSRIEDAVSGKGGTKKNKNIKNTNAKKELPHVEEQCDE